MPGQKYRFTEDQKDEIVKLYLAGSTLKELAGVMFCGSRQPIRRVLREQEVPLRDRWTNLRAVVVDGRKCCSVCKQWVVLDCFYVSSATSSGKTSACKICVDRIQKADYENHVARKYGISRHDYLVLLAKHDGKCHICGLTPRVGRARSSRLTVDHCHETLLVRGLLCHLCNKLLGQAKDDSCRLRRAADYLDDARK